MILSEYINISQKNALNQSAAIHISDYFEKTKQNCF